MWQRGGKSTPDKAKPSRHRKISLMLIPSLFSFLNFFFPLKEQECSEWCVCLCANILHRAFLPWWDPADLGGGDAVVGHKHRCHQVPAGRGICCFPSIPALQCSKRRRYKGLSVFIHFLFLPHFLKLLLDLCPLPLKKLLSAAL